MNGIIVDCLRIPSRPHGSIGNEEFPRRFTLVNRRPLNLKRNTRILLFVDQSSCGHHREP
jgi:hypothetical protein